MPADIKRPEKPHIPKVGEVVVCEVVKPHDGIPSGERRKVRVDAVVKYMIKEGFWKIIG